MIDAMAVAAVEPGCGAKPPNRVLDEPREVGGVGGVEPPRIDAAGNPLDDGGATAGGIAAGAVGVLGLPSDVHSYALIPIGYPMGRFGPVRRVPLADVTYGDRWDQSYRDS